MAMVCYHVHPTPDENGDYQCVLVKENDPVHTRTIWNFGKDYEVAKQLCKEKNERINLKERIVKAIIESSGNFNKVV